MFKTTLGQISACLKTEEGRKEGYTYHMLIPLCPGALTTISPSLSSYSKHTLTHTKRHPEMVQGLVCFCHHVSFDAKMIEDLSIFSTVWIRDSGDSNELRRAKKTRPRLVTNDTGQETQHKYI